MARVIKALDLKSNGNFPRRFEPYSQRNFSHILILFVEMDMSIFQIKIKKINTI